ncbi:MAG: hypothetical protein OK442_05610 [Thaumarchaeota archaeon]|nr:hypothetical protein [Nitrososphaerota archaeon]
MARRSRRQKPFWTKRTIRGIVAAGLVLWIVLALSVPATTYDSLFGTKRVTIDGTYVLHIPGLPPVEYSADINYSATGDFSAGAGNPIHMSALIYDANRSDFGNVYGGIGLLFQAVQLGTNGQGIVPQLRPAGLGNWTAGGTISFYQPVNFTGPVLSPLPGALPANSNSSSLVNQVTSEVKAYNYSFPALRPQSYTDALSDEESILRYGVAGSAIVLVFLLPVFDGVLLPKRIEEDPGV